MSFKKSINKNKLKKRSNNSKKRRNNYKKRRNNSKKRRNNSKKRRNNSKKQKGGDNCEINELNGECLGFKSTEPFLYTIIEDHPKHSHVIGGRTYLDFFGNNIVTGYGTKVKEETNKCSITISSNIHTIKAFAFNGYGGSNDKEKELIIPSKVSKIEKYAFNGWENTVTEVLYIPESVKFIERNAFSNFKNLKKVILDTDANTVFEENAFQNCLDLETIVWVHAHNYMDHTKKRSIFGIFDSCNNLKFIYAKTKNNDNDQNISIKIPGSHDPITIKLYDGEFKHYIDNYRWKTNQPNQKKIIMLPHEKLNHEHYFKEYIVKKIEEERIKKRLEELRNHNKRISEAIEEAMEQDHDHSNHW